MLELTDKNWDREVLDSSLPVVVDFWGPACTPCKQLEPLLLDTEGKYRGVLKFAKINAASHADLAARYGVRSIPTLLLFREGKVVGQTVGNMPTRTLITFLHKVL